MPGIQIWHMNETILTTIATAEMCANSMLRTFRLCVIAVIQDHELDITKDGFHRVVVRAAFGQTDPMEVQVTHDLTGQPRLAGMGAVLIQDNPNGNVRIPVTEVM